MIELYQKKKAQPMVPYNPEVGMPKCVSVSDADKANGSPKLGDMIAINPKDINDMWLVAKEFFEENYEKIPSDNKKVNHE